MMTGRVTSGRELTDLELQMVQWLPMQLSFTDIGHRLGMNGPAARALAITLYRRLGVASRHDAVQRCIQLGLVQPDPQRDDRDAVEAERDLRASLEDLDEAFFQMTAVREPSGRIVDFRYEYCNRAGLVVLGRHRDDVFGQRLLELFPSHRSDGLFDAFVHVTETGAPLRYEFSFDDGGVVGEFEVLVSRHGDGYVLSGHEITERKSRERTLIAVKDQLRDALSSRVVVEQAIGYVAALSGIPPETALTAMRRHARDHHLLIGDVARSVMSGDIDLSSEVEGSA